MDKQEYDAWLKETQASKLHWQVDQVTLQNGRGELIYIGGAEKGQFVHIHPDGKLQIGRYEGAFPHIGEALFKVEATKQYPSATKAFEACVNGGGMKFLLDVLGIRAYVR